MPKIGTQYPLTVTLRDHAGGLKSVRLHLGAITAGSFDSLRGEVDYLLNRMDQLSNATVAAWSWGIETVVSNALPATKQSQHSNQLRVRLRGEVSGRLHSFRIPSADFSVLNFAQGKNGDAVIVHGDGASGAVFAFVDNFQFWGRLPGDPDEFVIVDRMEVVE
jgi:hypothetical protein